MGTRQWKAARISARIGLINTMVFTHLPSNVLLILVPLMPTLHPAYLLRQPAHKKLAWRDLQAVRDKMKSLDLPLRVAGTGDAG